MIVYCLGMQSSGSTWLYNIVRELRAAAGSQTSATYRAELFEHFLDDRAFGVGDAILRGHNVESGLLRLLSLTGVKTIISYRDPRDAVTSFMQRFQDYGATFLSSCNDVSRNLASLISAGQVTPHLSFFYEDRFTENPDSVRKVADFLDLDVPAAKQMAIFEKYESRNVRSFIENIKSLPSDRLFVDESKNAMDRETSFHRTHMSDMKIGKWRDVLPPKEQAMVSELFGGYAELLDGRRFESGEHRGLAPWAEVPQPFTAVFSSKIFAKTDDIHKSARPLLSGSLLSPLGIKVLCLIYLPQGRWSIRIRFRHAEKFRVNVCQFGNVIHRSDEVAGEVQFEVHNKLHDHPFDVNVIYDGMTKDAEDDVPPPAAEMQADFISA